MRPVQVVTELTTVAGYMEWMAPSAYLALVVVAIAWVLALLALLGWNAHASVAAEASKTQWPVRALATFGPVSAGAAYIPLLFLLLSCFSCQSTAVRGRPSMDCHLPYAPPTPLTHTDTHARAQDNPFWAAMGYECYAGSHLATAFAAALLTPAYVGVAALFTVTYLDTNPVTSSWSGRVHGRADAVLLTIKTLLVLLVQVFPSQVGGLGLAALVMASTATVAAVYAWILPFSHHIVNRLMVAGATCAMWMGYCALMGSVLPSYDAAVMLYIGGPLAAAAGSALADLRVSRIIRTPVAALRSPQEAELAVRYFLHTALWGHATEEVAMRTAVVAATASAGGEAAAASGTEKPRLHGAGDELASSDDVEARMKQIRAVLPPAAVKEAETLLRAALGRFKDSAMLQVVAARFYSVYLDNTHMQMSHLVRAERRNPLPDIQYFIFQARRRAEDAASAKGQMSVMARVAYEAHIADAKHAVHNALAQQVAFWGELAAPVPDVTRCHRILGDMNRAIASAETAFRKVLEINSQSLAALRLYAEFCMYVVNNTDKAAMLLAEADRLEEQAAKEHERETGAAIRMLEHCNLDVFADNTAVVTISGSYHNMGIILSVSPFTSKMFGYSRYQMERRPIDMLVPPPLAESHDFYMRAYVDTGEGRVVDYTRAVFGLHRYGTHTHILSPPLHSHN